MLSGMGHGSSLPSESSCTGRPAMVLASTVETTGNGFCAAAVATNTNPNTVEKTRRFIPGLQLQIDLIAAAFFRWGWKDVVPVLAPKGPAVNSRKF